VSLSSSLLYKKHFLPRRSFVAAMEFPDLDEPGHPFSDDEEEFIKVPSSSPRVISPLIYPLKLNE
jgi:hypothetical protein